MEFCEAEGEISWPVQGRACSIFEPGGGARCVVHGPKVEGAKAFEAVVLDRAECVVGGGGLVP